MKCNICGAVNPDDKKFCSRCGGNLYTGHPNAGDERFVGYDGHDLTSANNTEENRRRLIAARQRRHLREQEKKQKTLSVILNILIAVIMAIMLFNTIYICVRRSALEQTFLSGYAGADVYERGVTVL